MSLPVQSYDYKLNALQNLIWQQSIMKGDFTLSSGAKSKYLFQLRQTTLHPEGAYLIGFIIRDMIQKENIRCIGGPEVGAIPIIGATTALCYQHGLNVASFFVRKNPKKHGAMEQIDGYVKWDGEVLMIDDVATSGNSILNAVNAIPDKYGAKVTKALCIVDREEGATELLAKHNIQLYSFFKKSDFNL